MLSADVTRAPWVPVWSPADDWILYRLGAGWKLISPDGKTTRDVSSNAMGYAFSADGRTIYGLRQPVPRGPIELFSISTSGGGEKRIGFLSPDDLPASPVSPGLRLSLTPDGKSLTYGTVRNTSSLWLMDGIGATLGRR